MAKKASKKGSSVKVKNKQSNKLKRRRNEAEKTAKKQRQDKRAKKRQQQKAKTPQPSRSPKVEGALAKSSDGKARKVKKNRLDASQENTKEKHDYKVTSLICKTFDAASLQKKVTGAAQEDDSDAEAPFERRPRSSQKWAEAEKRKDRLPIKNAAGSMLSLTVKGGGNHHLPLRLRQQTTLQKKKEKEGDGTEDSEEEEKGSVENSVGEENGDQEEMEGDDEEDEEEEDMEEEATEEGQNLQHHKDESARQQLSKAQQAMREIKMVMEAKSTLAEIAETLLEAPKKNIKRISEIAKIMANSPSLKIRKLALMTQVEVLGDLIPGYRIVLPTDEEKAKPVTKLVAQQRKYESALLRSYSSLVKFLASRARKANRKWNRKAKEGRFSSSMDMCAIRCLARLLHTAHLFNLRKEVIRATIPLLNHPNEEVRQTVLSGVQKLFRADAQGDSTLEVVRLISQIAVSQGQKVRAEMVATFLELNLSKDVIHGGSKQRGPVSKKKLSKKALQRRKRLKDVDEQLDRDLKESSAILDPKRQSKLQTQLISHVFTTYFRVLKRFSTSSALPTVLKGIAKFSNLINIELVLDLLQCLKQLIKASVEEFANLDKERGVWESIVIITNIVIRMIKNYCTLARHHGLISVDLMEYYTTMYQSIWFLCNPLEHKNLSLALICIRQMLIRADVPKERAIAFSKRLLIVSSYLPPHGALAVLHLVNEIRQKHPCVKCLMDEEELPDGGAEGGIIGGQGVYEMFLEDPDHANASSSAGWSSLLHTSSHHPYLSQYSKQCFFEQKIPAVLVRVPAVQILEQYDSSEGGFNPPLSLEGKLTKKEERRREILRKIKFQNLRDEEEQAASSNLTKKETSNGSSKMAPGCRGSSLIFAKLHREETRFAMRSTLVKMQAILRLYKENK
eukprot:jgi/Bigna1/144874/aug1.92_g19582